MFEIFMYLTFTGIHWCIKFVYVFFAGCNTVDSGRIKDLKVDQIHTVQNVTGAYAGCKRRWTHWDSIIPVSIIGCAACSTKFNKEQLLWLS